MSKTVEDFERSGPAVVCHLLGVVDFAACLDLQQRLVFDSVSRQNGQITILIAEHPPGITIGREGSRADVHFDNDELRSRQWPVQWVSRGGGALGHAPGQLAIYPIVPLDKYRLTVGDYLNHLQAALLAAITEEGFHVQPGSDRRSIVGRTGQVAALAVAVKHWTTYFGAYVNVLPYSSVLWQRVDTRSGQVSPAGCLLAERRQPAKMTSLREKMARHVSGAFGCGRYHLVTGHPLLGRHSQSLREANARVG